MPLSTSLTLIRICGNAVITEARSRSDLRRRSPPPTAGACEERQLRPPSPVVAWSSRIT
ncbi:hypothetical protein [Nonomuraea dietziae]|uniref:hypothetical protein n=1 Tax=Nonomuraea dietziae TaxID=65515 RepID=UPI0031E3261C